MKKRKLNTVVMAPIVSPRSNNTQNQLETISNQNRQNIELPQRQGTINPAHLQVLDRYEMSSIGDNDIVSDVGNSVHFKPIVVVDTAG